MTGSVEPLAALTQLRELWLHTTGVTGSVEPLGSLTQLTELRLQRTRVTGSVEPLAALSLLWSLGLYDTDVTGSVEPLGSLTQLRELWLYATGVTGSVEPLASLTQLTHLQLRDTNVYGDAAHIRDRVPGLSAWGSNFNDFTACSNFGGCVPGTELVHSADTFVGRAASACCANLGYEHSGDSLMAQQLPTQKLAVLSVIVAVLARVWRRPRPTNVEQPLEEVVVMVPQIVEDASFTCPVVGQEHLADEALLSSLFAGEQTVESLRANGHVGRLTRVTELELEQAGMPLLQRRTLMAMLREDNAAPTALDQAFTQP